MLTEHTRVLLLTVALISAHPSTTPSASAQTLRVIDGDTFQLGSERIRVWGLSCPERFSPGGPTATTQARWLLEGNSLHLQRKGLDRWGRTVARVLVQRTTRGEFFTFDFACAMISLGTCTESTHFSHGFYTRCTQRSKGPSQ